MFILLPNGASRLAALDTVPYDSRSRKKIRSTCLLKEHNPPASPIQIQQLLTIRLTAKAGRAGNPKGDTNIHDQPYTNSTDDFSSTDIVEWKPSCGASNFLGETLVQK